MGTEVSYPHIEKPEGLPARLTRTPRVRVAQIALDVVHHGWSVDMMCEQYPHLSPAEVHSAMAYYWDHRVEIEDDIRQEIELVDSLRQGPPDPFRERLQNLKRI